MNSINSKVMTLHRKLLLVLMLLSMGTAGVFSVTLYLEKRHDLMAGMDQKLKTAAYMARGALPADYHDRVVGPGSIPDAEYQSVVDRYNRLCTELGMEYLWSLMDVDGTIVFTTATSPDKVAANRKHAGFFEVHSNPELYTGTFASQKPSYQINDDKWGRIRVALIPFRDVKGRPYLFGASIRLTEIDRQLREVLYTSILISLALLAGTFGISLLFARSVTQPIRRLTATIKEIAAGNPGIIAEESGSYEQIVLAGSFNRLNSALQENITDLKRSESNLMQQTSLVRALLHSIPDLIFFKDRDGVYLGCNSQFARFAGRPEEEICGRTDYELFPKDLADFFRINDRIMMEQGVPRHNEVWIDYPDGARVLIDTLKAPLRALNGDVIGILGVSRDITERKQMDEALLASDQFSRQVISSAKEGIIVYGTDLRYKVWNRFMEELTGITADHVIGHHPLEVFPFLKDVGVIERLEKVLAGEMVDPIEFPFTTKVRSGWNIDSSVPLLNEQSEIIGVLATVQETTERRVAEQFLRESEEKFRSIVESSPLAMYFYRLDSNGDLILTGANPASDRIIGIPHEELIGKRIEDAFPNLQQTDIPEMYRKVAKGELGQQAFEITYNDERVNGIYSVQVYLTGPGTIAVDFLDITDRKRAEEEHVNLEKQLLHAQKLESLGVLAGGIAHDFNNLLTAIVGNTDLALMRLNPESPVRDNLERIEQAANRAADLAKQMLAYSGRGKFVIEPIVLNRLVEEMAHMLQVSISKKAVLRFNFAETLPTVDADATQLRQIIMNLVINASEAIGNKSGVIAISTGCMQCDRKYLSSALLNEQIPEGLYVWLEIADTGCGMDKETLSKIFDPFFTTKFTGRGLGMSAVLGIVRGHKGAIRVYSEAGKGTTFKVFLPAGDKPKELFNCDQQKQTVWKGSGTVLLVDDEETVIGIGSEMLKELGFSVLTAMDGREAVETYKQHQDIAFVILDLTMPHMDGEQCFRELRKLNPEIKVIMSSGYNEQEVTQKFAGKGLAGFVQKPYKMSVLQQAIQNI